MSSLNPYITIGNSIELSPPPTAPGEGRAYIKRTMLTEYQGNVRVYEVPPDGDDLVISNPETETDPFIPISTIEKQIFSWPIYSSMHLNVPGPTQTSPIPKITFPSLPFFPAKELFNTPIYPEKQGVSKLNSGYPTPNGSWIATPLVPKPISTQEQNTYGLIDMVSNAGIRSFTVGLSPADTDVTKFPFVWKSTESSPGVPATTAESFSDPQTNNTSDIVSFCETNVYPRANISPSGNTQDFVLSLYHNKDYGKTVTNGIIDEGSESLWDGFKRDYLGISNTQSFSTVGQGAFVLSLGIKAINQDSTSPDKNWSINISIGDLGIKISGESIFFTNRKTTKKDSKTVEVPTKFTSLSAGGTIEATTSIAKWKPNAIYELFIYPVWNGVIISNGVYGTGGNYKFLRIDNSLNLFDKKIIDEKKLLDNPTDVDASKAYPAIFDLGSSINMTFRNCNLAAAYTPVFFSPRYDFDLFFKSPKDLLKYEYETDLYLLWASNKIGTKADIASAEAWNYPKLKEEKVFKRSKITVFNGNEAKPILGRISGEVFGYYTRVNEKASAVLSGETYETAYDPPRKNGNFYLCWFGANSLPGDSQALSERISVKTQFGNAYTNPNWARYITNISSTVSLDGSSASITLDKYGLAGQGTIASQMIGAITIDVNGGPTGVFPGRIFSGISYGISESDNYSDSVWTINCVSMYKKLEDMILMCAPFFDGYPVDQVIKFLAYYCGINMSDNVETTAIDWKTDKCPASSDIHISLLNYKTGTPVKQALDDVLDKIFYHYYIDRHGKMRVYKLNPKTALPYILGDDQKRGTYNDAKIISVDYNPDFEDLRNQIMVMSLKKGYTTNGSLDPAEVPIDFAKLIDFNNTYPSIPWQKGLMQTYPGVVENEEDLTPFLERLKMDTRRFEWSGKIQIPGNALIQPYDKWGENFVVTSVTQNVDLVSKTWTTNLDLALGENTDLSNIDTTSLI